VRGESDLTRRTVQEEIVCDRCGIKETVEGCMDYGLPSKTMLSKLFPVWNYQKPEGWIAIGSALHSLEGTSDLCPKCAKELEQLISEFFTVKQ